MTNATETIRDVVTAWAQQGDACPVPVPLGALREILDEIELLRSEAGETQERTKEKNHG